MELPAGFDLEEYGRSLYELRDEAVSLGWADCGNEEWLPTENDCHGNVAKLCAMDSSLVPVRGWLYYELTDLNQVLFVAHSVVRSDGGGFYDITPPNTIVRPPFIVSNDSEEFFEYLVLNVGDFYFKPSD